MLFRQTVSIALTILLLCGSGIVPVFAQRLPRNADNRNIPDLSTVDDGSDKTSDKPEEEDQQDGANAAPGKNPFFEHLVSPDRGSQRQYDQAVRLIQAERVAEAAQLLGAILESSVDCFVPSEASDGRDVWDDRHRTTDRTFVGLVLETLQGLPSKGKESYAMQYETQARRLLENAVRAGSLEGVQQVARNYFPTSSGKTATFLIGVEQFEKGDWEAAMLTFRRLENVRPGNRETRNREEGLPFEPMLSLMSATCQLRAQRPEDAKRTVDRFWERFPQPDILLGDRETWKPKSSDEILAKLRSVIEAGETISTADWLERTGWPLPDGTGTQNPQTRAGLPLLEPTWSVPVLEGGQVASQVRQLLRHVEHSNDAYIPAARPILVRDLILLRGIGDLTAVDVKTGKRLWNATESDYRIHPAIRVPFFRPTFRQLASSPSHWLRFALRIFFWHDRISHQMTVDGSRVFVVEGLDPMPAFNLGRGGRQNIVLGNQATEDPRSQPGNTLVARDVGTGRILWQAGKFPYAQKVFDGLARQYEELEREKRAVRETGRQKKNEPSKPAGEHGQKQAEKQTETRSEPMEKRFSEEELFLGETWFLGAPLPFQGRLYVVGEHAGVLHLIVLDAATGTLVSRQPLTQAPSPFENDFLRRYYGLLPSVSGGVLLCPTGTGLVAAVDATTLKPLWCFSSIQPPEADSALPGQFQHRFFPHEQSGENDEFRRLFAKSGWQVPCLMIDGSTVLVAPSDATTLYCLDLTTGKPIWKNERFNRDNALYVACIREGKAYIVTPVSMIALSMETGQPVWEFVLKENESGKSKPEIGGGKPIDEIKRRRNIAASIEAVERNLSGSPESPKIKLDSFQKDKTVVEMPKIVFPESLKPVGIGVHAENRYYLPLSNGLLGIVDLDHVRLDLVSAHSVAPSPIGTKPGEIRLESSTIDSPLSEAPAEISADLAGTVFGDPLTTDQASLGNLIGLQGCFFSQSPARLQHFDQWAVLKSRTEARLKSNPDDPEALIQAGRIHRADGEVDKAVFAFRRSMRATPSASAADYLRKTLLQAIRSDYASWKTSGEELENLAEFPEELGEILFEWARGSLRDGDAETFRNVLNKAILLELDYPVRITAESELTLQLHRALGLLIEQRRLRAGGADALNRGVEEFADNLFQRLDSGGSLNEFLSGRLEAGRSDSIVRRFRSRPWWEQDSFLLSDGIYHCRLFIELFESLPISKRAERLLQERYEKNRLFTALEMMLDPPVLRSFPFPETADNAPVALKPLVPLDADRERSDSVSPVLPALPDSLRRSPVWPEWTVIERLAGYLEACKNVADAAYYHQLLVDHADRRGKSAGLAALERPAFAEMRRRQRLDRDWPKGETVFHEGESSPDTTALERNNPHGWPVTRILQSIRTRNRNVGNQVGVPYLGPYNPFMSPFTFSMEVSYHRSSSLICYDRTGDERWRLDLSQILPDLADYGYFSDNNNHYKQGFVEQNIYLRGCNHLLLLIRGNVVVAVDTFGADSVEGPRLLWTKRTTTPLATRQMFTAMPLHRLISSDASGGWTFPRESIFVSGKIVCYRDADHLYGLDPMTGKILWTRELNTLSCSIFGDREHLFLVFPDSQQVSALDPTGGRELLRGSIPPGTVFAYETKLVSLEQQSQKSRRPTFRLRIADLRDLFDLGLNEFDSESKNEPKTMVDSIPTYAFQDGLSGNSQIRTVFDGQVLATLSWETKSLRLYDLSNARDLLGPVGDGGSCSGVMLPLSEHKKFEPYDCDLDVARYDGKYLVQFVDKRRVDTTQKNLIENGVAFRRHCNVVSNVACRSIGSGIMMLYDPAGNECWPKPAKINDWFQLRNVPEACPVALFALSVTDQEKDKPPYFLTALLGVDLATGKTHFSKMIPALPDQGLSALNGFRVTVQPEEREISFVAANRTVRARFTAGVASPETPDSKPKVPSTLRERLETIDWFKLFAD